MSVPPSMPMGQDQGPGPHPGGELERLKGWLVSPQKLLRVVTGAAAHAGPLHRDSVDTRLQEEDVITLVRLLAHVALVSRQVKDEAEATVLTGFFRQRLQNLPVDLVVTLERILGQLAGGEPAEAPLPVELSEQLCLRLAGEAYQRGEVSATSVHALLGRMSGEIGTLRRTLGVAAADDYSDRLETEFWTTLSEPERRRVLTSVDAWCVPPRALRRALDELEEQPDAVRNILEHYAGCAHHTSESARSRAALGMTELADLYARYDGKLLEIAIGHAGSQLTRESRQEMQSLFATAFARLSQKAAGRRGFRALRQALELLGAIERAQPPRGQELRGQVAVESHLREFIREAAEAPSVPGELVELLRQVPVAAAELLGEAFEASPQRPARERLVELARGVGPAGITRLREKLRTAPAAAAVNVVGLLSRLEPVALAELLPALLGRWSRDVHDVLVRSLAAGGAPERGQLLLRLLDSLHPLVLPAAVDEIGMSGDREAAPRLMRLAGGALPQSSEPYLRLKAVEALGRLREPLAAPLLRQLIEAKSVWRWTEPREIRIAAAQALLKIDPEWGQRSLRRSGLAEAELVVAPLDPQPASPWMRQRRYARIPLAHRLPVTATTLRGQWTLSTQVLSLGGGLAESPSMLAPGTEMEMQIPAGLRPLRVTALVRDPRPPLLGFEIVQISLDDRARLRRLLQPHLNLLSSSLVAG